MRSIFLFYILHTRKKRYKIIYTFEQKALYISRRIYLASRKLREDPISLELISPIVRYLLQDTWDPHGQLVRVEIGNNGSVRTYRGQRKSSGSRIESLQPLWPIFYLGASGRVLDGAETCPSLRPALAARLQAAPESRTLGLRVRGIAPRWIFYSRNCGLWGGWPA